MSPTGLRERKKRDTHRALSGAAQELVHAHGLDGVTVEQIADAAGVSVRTFFNYFSCKEEAIVGIEPAVLAELHDDLLARPATEGPIEALHAVLVPDQGAGPMLRSWRLRNELVERYPALVPRHLTTMVQIERALASALAVRIGTDPTRDPAPRILVATALAALRSALSWSAETGHEGRIDSLLDAAFDHLRVPGDPR